MEQRAGSQPLVSASHQLLNADIRKTGSPDPLDSRLFGVSQLRFQLSARRAGNDKSQ